MNNKKPKFIQFDKCVHIHACRRFAEIVERKTGKKISRGCGENCSAYQELEGLVTDAVYKELLIAMRQKIDAILGEGGQHE